MITLDSATELRWFPPYRAHFGVLFSLHPVPLGQKMLCVPRTRLVYVRHTAKGSTPSDHTARGCRCCTVFRLIVNLVL